MTFCASCTFRTGLRRFYATLAGGFLAFHIPGTTGFTPSCLAGFPLKAALTADLFALDIPGAARIAPHIFALLAFGTNGARLSCLDYFKTRDATVRAKQMEVAQIIWLKVLGGELPRRRSDMAFCEPVRS